MSVIGTPVTPPEDIVCDTLQKAGPTITQLYGVELPTKRRAVQISQGQVANTEFHFYDRSGNPVDLTECSLEDENEATISLRIREAITTCDNRIYETTATITTATTGLVEASIPAAVSRNPGVYLMEAGILDTDSNLIFSNQFYLWVDRGLFGDPQYPNGGPPALDDIRLALRDNAPEENRLIDEFEFDLAEVCHSAVYTCRYWNECQPPINQSFNTMTYPAKLRWLDAICGQLFMIAANRFRRNHLPYQAGGTAIDDQNKFMQYEQIGMKMLMDYREWVKQKKVEINCNAAITSGGSAYGLLTYFLNDGSGGV